MSDLLTIKDDIKALLQADAPLLAYINSKNFYLDVATALPAVTYGGFVSVGDKVGTTTFQLALVANTDGSAASHATFLQMCQRLQALINACPSIIGGEWLSRNEPQNKVLRAVFPCTTYLSAS